MIVQSLNKTMILYFKSPSLNICNSTAGDQSLCEPNQENQYNSLKWNKTTQSSHTCWHTPIDLLEDKGKWIPKRLRPASSTQWVLRQLGYIARPHSTTTTTRRQIYLTTNIIQWSTNIITIAVISERWSIRK